MDKLFEIEKLYHLEALEIFHSRNKSKIIHRSSDIKASGNEVEETVRQIFQKKLPTGFYITNGHIVDKNLKSSNQFDVIIANNSTSPVLFKTNDKTEYLTYESVYAIGEIKSTYNKYEKQINDFVEKTKYLYENLHRENTTPDYLVNDVKIQLPDFVSLESSDKRPYKNPLFKFMIFVNSEQFYFSAEANKIGPVFSQNDLKYLPNIICFLDKGVFVLSKVQGDLPASMELYPEFINTDSNHKWTFREFGNTEFIAGSNLAWLMVSIIGHLNLSHLLRPNMMDYLNHMFTGGKTSHLDIIKTSRPATAEEIEQIVKNLR